MRCVLEKEFETKTKSARLSGRFKLAREISGKQPIFGTISPIDDEKRSVISG
jgi:hypothetical protein